MSTKRNQAKTYRKVPGFMRDPWAKAGLTQRDLAEGGAEDGEGSFSEEEGVHDSAMNDSFSACVYPQ